MQEKILEYEKEIKRIEANKSEMTQEEIIKQTKIATEKLEQETRSAKVKGNIDEATEQTIIKNTQLAQQQLTVQIEATKAGTEKTKQETENLKEDEVQKTLENELRKNGVQPGDSPAMRIVSNVITNAGTSLKKMQYKMGEIVKWLKGENGSQTKERFEEIWSQ